MTKLSSEHPTFLYIGASRAGSSWLFNIFKEHPEIFVPVAKDIMFFDLNYERGLDWYLSHFKDSQSYKAIGELSHDYFLKEETAKKIYKDLPNVKLICCLREPVEKTISMYHYNKTNTFLYRTRNEPAHKITFESFIKIPDVLKLVDYYNNLKPFYDLFPKRNVLILFYDDLAKDPKTFIKRIFEFLAVDSGFNPASLKKFINSARDARFLPFAIIVYKIGQWFRRLGLPNVVGSVKHRGIFVSLMYKSSKNKIEVPEELSHQLYKTFNMNYKKLEELIGCNLPPGWYDVSQ